MYITYAGDIHFINRSYAVVVQQELCQTADFATICSKLCSCEWSILQDMCISGGQECTHLLRPLLLLLSVCENAMKARSSFEPLKLVTFKRPQRMNTGSYQDRTCTRLKICFCAFRNSSHDVLHPHYIWSYNVLWFWCAWVTLSNRIS